MPVEFEGLAQIKRNIDKINITEVLKTGLCSVLEIHLPKFKIETKTDLKPILQKVNSKFILFYSNNIYLFFKMSIFNILNIFYFFRWEWTICSRLVPTFLTCQIHLSRSIRLSRKHLLSLMRKVAKLQLSNQVRMESIYVTALTNKLKRFFKDFFVYFPFEFISSIFYLKDANFFLLLHNSIELLCNMKYNTTHN